MTETRTETDSFGQIEVPADCYWGAQTQRSLGNFAFPPQERMPIAIIHALAPISSRSRSGRPAAAPRAT